MLTREQKQVAVTEIKDKFTRATAIFAADYRGLSVQDLNELRAKLHASEDDCEYKVIKNTLLRRAVGGSDAEALSHHFSGPTALAFGYGDSVTLAKILVDYSKDHEAFELKGGLFEGKAIEPAEIATLATLPSLQELRATLVGLIQAPSQKIAAVMQAPAGQLARLAEARRAKLEESAGGA